MGALQRPFVRRKDELLLEAPPRFAVRLASGEVGYYSKVHHAAVEDDADAPLVTFLEDRTYTRGEVYERALRNNHELYGVAFTIGIVLMIFLWAKPMRFEPLDRELQPRLRLVDQDELRRARLEAVLGLEAAGRLENGPTASENSGGGGFGPGLGGELAHGAGGGELGGVDDGGERDAQLAVLGVDHGGSLGQGDLRAGAARLAGQAGPFPDHGGARAGHVRKQLRLDRFQSLISDPVGHFKQTLHWGENSFDPLTFFTSVARTHGDVARWAFGSQPVYLVSHPDAIEDIYTERNGVAPKGLILDLRRAEGELLAVRAGEILASRSLAAA